MMPSPVSPSVYCFLLSHSHQHCWRQLDAADYEMRSPAKRNIFERNLHAGY